MIRAGIDVYIGYCPDAGCKGEARRARCSVGHVVEGPFPPYAKLPHTNAVIGSVSWQVQVDGAGYRIAERLLTPIDKDDQSETRKREAEA